MMNAIVMILSFVVVSANQTAAEVILPEKFDTVDQCHEYAMKDGWGIRQPGPVFVEYRCEVDPR